MLRSIVSDMPCARSCRSSAIVQSCRQHTYKSWSHLIAFKRDDHCPIKVTQRVRTQETLARERVRLLCKELDRHHDEQHHDDIAMFWTDGTSRCHLRVA